MKRMLRMAAVAALILIASACGKSSVPNGGGTLPGFPPHKGVRASGATYVFSGNVNANTITQYDFYAGTLIRTIGNGVNSPMALAVAADGTLYAANNPLSGSGSVTVYDNSGNLLRTITNGISQPSALAIDHAGNLYVENNSNVTVYAPGTTSPSVTIGSGAGFLQGMAIDGNGTLYVADVDNSIVSEYTASTGTLLRTLSVTAPQGVGVNGKGELVVTSCANCGSGGFNSNAYVYAPAQTSPMAILGGLNQPGFALVDDLGNVYVATQSGIEIYPVNAWNSPTIVPAAPIEMAIDLNGDLAETDLGQAVNTYAYGSFTTIQSITQTGGPWGIATFN